MASVKACGIAGAAAIGYTVSLYYDIGCTDPDYFLAVGAAESKVPSAPTLSTAIEDSVICSGSWESVDGAEPVVGAAGAAAVGAIAVDGIVGVEDELL